jgi:hypothetical protein
MPVGCMASTARLSTAGRPWSIVSAPRSCAPESGEPHRCPTRSRCWSSSASSPSLWAFPAMARRTSPQSCDAPSGAASLSRLTASGASCAATAATRAPCAVVFWPAMRRHRSRRASPSPSASRETRRDGAAAGGRAPHRRRWPSREGLLCVRAAHRSHVAAAALRGLGRSAARADVDAAARDRTGGAGACRRARLRSRPRPCRRGRRWPGAHGL